MNFTDYFTNPKKCLFTYSTIFTISTFGVFYSINELNEIKKESLEKRIELEEKRDFNKGVFTVSLFTGLMSLGLGKKFYFKK